MLRFSGSKIGSNEVKSTNNGTFKHSSATFMSGWPCSDLCRFCIPCCQVHFVHSHKNLAAKLLNFSQSSVLLVIINILFNFIIYRKSMNTEQLSMDFALIVKVKVTTKFDRREIVQLKD